jgi:hypothetical protein
MILFNRALTNNQTVHMESQHKTLVDSQAAAKLLGITVDQLRRRVRGGTIEPAYRSRNTLLFSREELERDHPADQSG